MPYVCALVDYVYTPRKLVHWDVIKFALKFCMRFSPLLARAVYCVINYCFVRGADHAYLLTDDLSRGVDIVDQTYRVPLQNIERSQFFYFNH